MTYPSCWFVDELRSIFSRRPSPARGTSHHDRDGDSSTASPSNNTQLNHPLLPNHQISRIVDASPAITLSDTPEEASDSQPRGVELAQSGCKLGVTRPSSPPPNYPVSEPSEPSGSSPRPPPFSSLYISTEEAVEAYKTAVTEAGASASVPAYSPAACESHQASASSQDVDVVAQTKSCLPQDTKGESSKKDDDSEPPPAYSEGSSPLESFTYLMAAAGGAASILTQVQQGGPPPINTLGGMTRGFQRLADANSNLQMSAPMRTSRWTYGTSYN